MPWWNPRVVADPGSRGSARVGEEPSVDPFLLRDHARLAELLHTFEITGNRYIAKSLAEALKSTITAEGSTASEIAGVAAAKASWTAAEKALAAYQATTLQITNPPPLGP